MSEFDLARELSATHAACLFQAHNTTIQILHVIRKFDIAHEKIRLDGNEEMTNNGRL